MPRLAGAAGGRQQSTQNFDVQKDTFKRYDTALDADQRLSRMEASYGKAVNGDQQAMLALLSDHLGMTMGLQRGARITKDILNEAQQSQPWLAQLGAKFDSRGFLSGVTLGKDQMAQMLDLGYEARDRSWQSAQDATQLYGVAPPKGAQAIFSKRNVGEKPALTGALPNGNGRQIDKTTAQQFYQAAGGDRVTLHGPLAPKLVRVALDAFLFRPEAEVVRNIEPGKVGFRCGAGHAPAPNRARARIPTPEIPASLSPP